MTTLPELAFRNMWFRSVLALSIAIGAFACALPIAGTYKDKTYTSPDGEFAVVPPPFPELGIKDTVFPDQLFADFSLGSGYWTPFGLYTVEWLKLKKPMAREDFASISADLTAEHLRNRFKGKKASFKIVDQAVVSDARQPGYRTLATGQAEGLDAYYLVTVFHFGDRIAFVSTMAAPSQMVGGGTMPRRLPVRNDWYSRMAESLVRLR